MVLARATHPSDAFSVTKAECVHAQGWGPVVQVGNQRQPPPPRRRRPLRGTRRGGRRRAPLIEAENRSRERCPARPGQGLVTIEPVYCTVGQPGPPPGRARGGRRPGATRDSDSASGRRPACGAPTVTGRSLRGVHAATTTVTSDPESNGARGQRELRLQHSRQVFAAQLATVCLVQQEAVLLPISARQQSLQQGKQPGVVKLKDEAKTQRY
jgi:hypothetical protein